MDTTEHASELEVYTPDCRCRTKKCRVVREPVPVTVNTYTHPGDANIDLREIFASPLLCNALLDLKEILISQLKLMPEQTVVST